MKCEDVFYNADGLNMVGELHWDESLTGTRPGIAIFPDAMGVSEHTKRRARMLADLGYVAMVCDLHGEAYYSEDIPEVMRRLEPFRTEPDRLRQRSQGAFDLLISRAEVDPKKVAAIGYCIGGAMALELARLGNDLAGSVAFHGRVTTSHPDGAGKIKGKVLACLGADDPFIPLEQRLKFEKEMRAAGVDWRMHVYGGVVHSFTIPGAERFEPASNRYNESADKRSWKEMLDFFDEIFA